MSAYLKIIELDQVEETSDSNPAGAYTKRVEVVEVINEQGDEFFEG